MKMRPEGADLFHVDRETDRQTDNKKDNNRFLQFYERA